MNTTTSPAGNSRSTSRCASRSSSRCGGDDWHHAFHQRQHARDLFAFGGGIDCCRRTQGGEKPRGFSFPRDGDDRRGPVRLWRASRRPRTRPAHAGSRFESGLKAGTRSEGIRSASTMTRLRVCTASIGYFPAAVSPASMIASAPSSTALAASLTSARVGRGDSRIDSSTCVATITGRPTARAERDDLFLNSRNLLQRHFETEIAARNHDAVCLGQNRVQMLDCGRPLNLRDNRHGSTGFAHQFLRSNHIVSGLHEAERHEVDAKFETEAQIGRVLVGNAGCGQTHAWSIDSLVLTKQATGHDRRFQFAG